jgi:hypothetical protein
MPKHINTSYFAIWITPVFLHYILLSHVFRSSNRSWKVNFKVTNQNFHIYFHARFDVMADPVPIISFNGYPPEHIIRCSRAN